MLSALSRVDGAAASVGAGVEADRSALHAASVSVELSELRQLRRRDDSVSSGDGEAGNDRAAQ